VAAAAPYLEAINLAPECRDTLNAALLDERIRQVGIIKIGAFEIGASK